MDLKPIQRSSFMAKFSREIYEQSKAGKWPVARIASTCGISKQAVCQMQKKYAAEDAEGGPKPKEKKIIHTQAPAVSA
jgi:hypothetical protein